MVSVALNFYLRGQDLIDFSNVFILEGIPRDRGSHRAIVSYWENVVDVVDYSGDVLALVCIVVILTIEHFSVNVVHYEPDNAHSEQDILLHYVKVHVAVV